MTGLETNSMLAVVPLHKCKNPRERQRDTISWNNEVVFASPVTIAMLATHSGFVSSTLAMPAMQDDIRERRAFEEAEEGLVLGPPTRDSCCMARLM